MENDLKTKRDEINSEISLLRGHLACPLDNRTGELLKEIRSQRKVYQTDLAAYLGVGQSVISSWESGRTKPDDEMIIKICDYLQIDPLAFYATLLSRSRLLKKGVLSPNNLSVEYFEQFTKPMWKKTEMLLAV